MTLPVFSEREVSNLRAMRLVCRTCKGDCRIVVSRPTKLYACGYATFCVTCPECHGLGTMETRPVTDFKTEACHDQP